jgi:hypothetical protein
MARVLLSCIAVSSYATQAVAGFVTTVLDANHTWWFEHDGARFMSFAMNHVNNGGQGEPLQRTHENRLHGSSSFGCCPNCVANR